MQFILSFYAKNTIFIQLNLCNMQIYVLGNSFFPNPSTVPDIAGKMKTT